MNIFILDPQPQTAAEMHCDKHVVKMIVETAQLLSAAHRLLDGNPKIFTAEFRGKLKRKKLYLLPGENWQFDNVSGKFLILNAKCYKATHFNHPCAVWARSTSENYRWLVTLLQHLCAEYTRRYRRVHVVETQLLPFLLHLPANIQQGDSTDFCQCMPVKYQVPDDAVAAYHAFYLGEKFRFAKWTDRQVPVWFSSSITSKGLNVSDFTRTRRLCSRSPQGH